MVPNDEKTPAADRGGTRTVGDNRVAYYDENVKHCIGSAESKIRRIYKYIIHISQLTREQNPLDSYLPDDSGRAEAFGDWFGRFIKWNSSMGFQVYDSDTGFWVGGDISVGVVYELLDFISIQAWDLRESSGDRDMLRSAREARTAQSKGRIFELLKKSAAIIAGPDEFDANPFDLNCQGDVYDLRTGDMRSATPEDLFTMSTGVKPLPGEPKRFYQFLNEITCGRNDLVSFLMRWFGFTLTGDKSCPYFLNMIGSGCNGKSVLMTVIRQVFGTYAVTIPHTVVVDIGRNGPRPDLVMLRGPRLGVINEIPPGRMSGDIKIITGDDPITADEKFKNPVTFKPVIKLVLVSNHQLEIRNVDEAYRRRLKKIPFDYRVPSEKIDPSLANTLIEETPQILNWLIQEAVEYLKNPGIKGFPHSETIEKASAEYLSDEDTIGRFLAERTERCISRVAAKDLHKTYTAWANDQGMEYHLGPRNFNEAVVSHGFLKVHTRDGAFFEGLGVTL